VSARPGRRERVDALRLIRTAGVGPVSVRAWSAPFGGSATRTIEALPEMLRRSGRTRPFRLSSESRAERELDDLERMGGRLLLPADPEWPPLLNFDNAPPLLSCLGARPDALSMRAAAVVGSRRCSASGRRFAAAVGSSLASKGWLVVSGLALGIDAAAHEGASPGPTAAALAGGVDVSYPVENRGLRADILERGALISESPLGQAPMARSFPRRNRLISGMSHGVLVVEAARDSGSLGTAEHARRQGRLVMAVPGAAGDARGRGVDALIAQGAERIESPTEVADALERAARGGGSGGAQLGLFRDGRGGGQPLDDLPAESEANGAREAAAAALSGGEAEYQREVAARLGGRAAAMRRAVFLAINELELAGRLERLDDGRVRVPPAEEGQ